MDNIDDNTDGVESTSEPEASENIEASVIDTNDTPAETTAAEGKNAEAAFSATVITRETSLSLPESVTIEPQDPEHLSLDILGDSKEGLNIYLRVSDDKGEYHGNPALEAEVKSFCDRYKEMDALPEAEINKVLEDGPALTKRYFRTINKAEALSKGMATKYQIRSGLVLLAQKAALKKLKKEKPWTEWFEEEFGLGPLRSAQVYMAVARIPNVIRYAILGMDRLYQIQRLVKDYRDEDPVWRFMQENNVVFDPEAYVDISESKIQIDITIAEQKLLENGLEGIDKEKVVALVRDGVDLEAKHISNLKLVKKANGDMNQYMDDIFASKGKPEPVPDPARKASMFKSTTDRFMKAMVQALEEDEYLSDITAHMIRQLKLKVDNLEAKLAGNQA